jgi:hypothetical protein
LLAAEPELPQPVSMTAATQASSVAATLAGIDALPMV